jgi:hypothetical protein
MVGTPPDAFAPGGFAHPTHLHLSGVSYCIGSLMTLRAHLCTGVLPKVMQ